MAVKILTCHEGAVSNGSKQWCCKQMALMP